jgi:ATP-dependent RNA helicase DDX27
MEDDEELGDRGATNASIRHMKKAIRPSKIGEPQTGLPKKRGQDRKKGKATKGKGGKVKGFGFGQDLGDKKGRSGSKGTSGGPREGMRANKGDSVSLSAKKGRAPKGGKHAKGKRKR